MVDIVREICRAFVDRNYSNVVKHALKEMIAEGIEEAALVLSNL